MATTIKYNLQQIHDISFSAFEFIIPDDTIQTINYLTSQVGSNSFISSNVFKKKEEQTVDSPSNTFSANNNSNFKGANKKRKGNRGMEISSDEWESLRIFQTTKIEQKTGLDADIDQIRLYLNKLTDKTFLDIREKMVAHLETLDSQTLSQEDANKISVIIYDLASCNKFYSKIFADLYAELASTYIWIKDVFNNKYANIMEIYKNIEYFDSDKDYDKFCEMNKLNEKRKAETMFLVNLANNGFIPKSGIVEILSKLLNLVMSMVCKPEKKNEVDELTENIALLFNKEFIEKTLEDTDNIEKYYISGQSMIDTVNSLAKAKAKDYPSLSNKSIFKYMDLVEI